jgi:hypothetical protein
MSKCPRCHTVFRTPEGEEQDHPCPHCNWEPGMPTRNTWSLDPADNWVDEDEFEDEEEEEE